MTTKKQICFKVAGTVADQIAKAVEEEGWGTTSKFCESIILDYLKRDRMRDTQRTITLETIESEEGIILIRKILDQELIRRAVGSIDTNGSK